MQLEFNDKVNVFFGDKKQERKKNTRLNMTSTGNNETTAICVETY